MPFPSQQTTDHGRFPCTDSSHAVISLDMTLAAGVTITVMAQSTPVRHTFPHEAMATTFAVTVASEDRRYARQAAQAAFDELDRIEGRLSRYIENSDVSRINHLPAGQMSVVHPDTFDCLRLGLEVQRATHGVFDVAYASRNTSKTGALFRLDSDRHAIEVLDNGLLLDLGGIGKGFALDRMAELLKDWELESVLLAASTSTLLAGTSPPGDRGWAATIGPRNAPHHLQLSKNAVSGSGRLERGYHIIDPKNGKPSEGRFRAWAIASTATMADALSTAFMVMPAEQVRGFCGRHLSVEAYLLDGAGESLVKFAAGG